MSHTYISVLPGFDFWADWEGLLISFYKRALRSRWGFVSGGIRLKTKLEWPPFESRTLRLQKWPQFFSSGLCSLFNVSTSTIFDVYFICRYLAFISLDIFHGISETSRKTAPGFDALFKATRCSYVNTV